MMARIELPESYFVAVPATVGATEEEMVAVERADGSVTEERIRVIEFSMNEAMIRLYNVAPAGLA